MMMSMMVRINFVVQTRNHIVYSLTCHRRLVYHYPLGVSHRCRCFLFIMHTFTIPDIQRRLDSSYKRVSGKRANCKMLECADRQKNPHFGKQHVNDAIRKESGVINLGSYEPLVIETGFHQCLYWLCRRSMVTRVTRRRVRVVRNTKCTSWRKGKQYWLVQLYQSRSSNSTSCNIEGSPVGT